MSRRDSVSETSVVHDTKVMFILEVSSSLILAVDPCADVVLKDVELLVSLSTKSYLFNTTETRWYSFMLFS